MRALRAGLLLFVLLLCAAPAAAAQRATMALDRVTLHEALLRIRYQLGWDLRGPSGEGTDWYEQADNAPRSSFNWKNATLGKICRDVGEAFHCVPQYGPQGTIQFENRADSGRSAISTTRENISFTLTDVSALRSVDLNAAKPQPRPSCQLKLAVRPFDSDLDYLYAVDKLQGVDNLGHAVRWDRKEPLRPQPLSAGGGGRPDEWQVEATLPNVDARATRLDRLEGELVLFRDVQNVRVEVPIQTAQLPLTRTAGPVEITIIQIQQPAPTSVQVRFEVTWPGDLEITTALHGNPGFPYAAVKLASGRISRTGGSATISTRDVTRRVLLNCVHEGNGSDPPVALIWDLAIKSQPDRRIPFRLENIPLPFGGAERGAAAAAPRPAAPSPGPALSPNGTLASEVIIGSRAAGDGELAIGLSVRKPNGAWDAVRWKQVPVDEEGVANLDGIPPGTYRVFRKFRARGPDGALQPATTGWANAEVVVHVEAGKTLKLPPLKRAP